MSINDPACPAGDQPPAGPIAPFYFNRHGKPVLVRISYHGRVRFVERFKAIFPKKMLPLNPDSVIAGLFNRATRLKKFNKHEKDRLSRHGADTLFFRNDVFTFVVQDRTIVTVEVSVNSQRHLNNSQKAELLARIAGPAPKQDPPRARQKISCFARLFHERNKTPLSVFFVAYEPDQPFPDIDSLAKDRVFQDLVRERARTHLEFPGYRLVGYTVRLGKKAKMTPIELEALGSSGA